MGSFMDSVTGGTGRIPLATTFRCTELGKEKIQDGSFDTGGRILVALETRGTSNTREIASASGLTRGQIEREIPRLVKAGYVLCASSPAVAAASDEM